MPLTKGKDLGAEEHEEGKDSDESNSEPATVARLRSKSLSFEGSFFGAVGRKIREMRSRRPVAASPEDETVDC